MKIDLEKIKAKPRNYDNFISEYLNYTSHLESPVDFHIWTAISVIAGALRGKCHIDMGSFKWKPNCFIIFVAPPGVVAKSTTSSIGMRLLRKVPGVHFGPSSTTWQALLGAFEEITETFEVEGKNQQQSCLTVEVSELGTFLDFNDGQMIDTIVDIWDGKDTPVVRRTMGGGTQTVQAPWLNMIACTTPSWVRDNLPQYAIGGGFTSRCMFIYADKKEKFIPYPADCMPAGIGLIEKKLVEDLTRISLLSGNFSLSPEAKRFGYDWYMDFFAKRPKHLNDESLAGYCARKQTHMHKIALCLSAARSNSQVIEVEDLEMALSLLASCEENLLTVFNNIADEKDAELLVVLRNKIVNHKEGIDRNELFLHMCSRMGWDSFDRVLNAGVSAGLWDNVIKAKGNLIRPTKLAYDKGSYKMDKSDKDRLATIKKQ